ncbi:MAG: SRPBCC family protein [Proteobacteria bacterium]|nr:SRPBCC family protein [Pseudomonadota bacterium]MBS0572668.1 SRPBCC family protein [Pseudomonadota bacterium]
MSDLDLVITRRMKASPARVWRCWTEPELIPQWFAPKPVIVKNVVIDLRPGGESSSTMVLPDGTEMPLLGCYLVVEPERRLVFTDCLGPGFRPLANPFFTAEVTMEPDGTGTLYTARAIHGNAENRRKHEEMGFFDGWGTVAGQLDELAATL